MNSDNTPLLAMPIKVKPYAHQVAAFNFVCELFGLISQNRGIQAGQTAQKGEVVHHINGNKLSNDPENLEVFPS